MKIALSGKMGSGKTTLAEELVKDYDFKRVSFANGVKDTAMNVFGMTYEQAYGAQKNRELLQKIGQKCREIEPNVWVNMTRRQIMDYDAQGYDIVVDDMRFKNEFDILRDLGFIMVRIDASPEVRRKRIPNTFAGENEISETDLDSIVESCSKGDTPREWNNIILNQGSKENFLKYGKLIYTHYKERDKLYI